MGTQQTAHQIPLHLGTTEFRNGKWRFNGTLKALPPGHPNWVWPLEWPGAEHPIMGDGEPSLIFVVGLGDLFAKRRPIADIDKVVTVITLSNHIGLLLTKYAQQMADYFAVPRSEQTLRRYQRKLWLGFSAEGQREFDRRWRAVRPLAQAGFVTFVSIAPMLEPLVLPPDFLALGERAWCIVGGEQFPGTRPMDPQWARCVRDQCAAAGVPFFLFQMAARKPIPLDLNIRQFPARQD